MCGSLEHGVGLRMRARIGPILTTIITNGAGSTTKVTGIMTITATTTIGITTTTAIENLPGTTARGRETVPPWRI